MESRKPLTDPASARDEESSVAEGELAPGGTEAPDFETDSAAPASSEPESAEELRNRWLRAEAELQNFRRRALREREDARRIAEEGVLLELIGVLDDLERGLAAMRSADAPPAWAQGFELVAARIREALTRAGVVRLEPAGLPFDPRFHEAMLEIPPAEGVKGGTVVQVVEPGYARGERALRAARVVVAGHEDA